MGGLSLGLAKPSFNDTFPNFWDSQPAPASKVDSSLPQNQSNKHGYEDVLQDVASTYPALAPHTKNALVYDATPPKGENSQLETFLPWEEWNPHPGKVTSELYRPYSNREQLRDAVAGDLIHMAGAIDPKTKKPVDPIYYDLKQEVKKARTPEQVKMDYRAYKEDVKNGEDRSFNKWFQDSRAEAYVRGRLFPDEKNDWAHVYKENPKLAKAIDKIGSYLRTGK